MRGVLLENLLTYPLRRRSGAAANSKLPGTATSLDFDPPLARALVGRDRHDGTDDPEFPQCCLGNSLDIDLIHTTPTYFSFASLIRSATFSAIGCASVPLEPAPCE